MSNLTEKPLIEVLKADVKQECEVSSVEEKEVIVSELEAEDLKPLICLVCGTCFTNVIDLQQHYVEHITLKPYKCKECDKSFISEDNLMKHEVKHSGLNPFKCDICKKRYTKKLKYEIQCCSHGTEHLCELCYELFSLHPLTDNEEEDLIRHSCETCDLRYVFKPIVDDERGYPKLIKPYLCQLCNKRYNTRGGLHRHSATHRIPNEKFFCNICDEGFSKLPNLNEHEKTHVKIKVRPNGVSYKCDLCDISFSIKRALEAHYNNEHEGNTKYECPTCNKGFFLHHLLQNHKYTHRDQRRFFCQYCPRQYKYKQDLTRHIMVHFGKKPFPCHVCKKRFTTKAMLKQHSIVHTNEKPFKCKFCFFSFNRKENLERHYLSHTNEKPFKCNKCTAAFTRKVALDNHLEAHDVSFEKFPCKHCDKVFGRLRYLRRHSKSAHPDITECYCCQVCGKLFKHQPSYLRHYKLHTGERPYRCKHCDKTYIQKIHLVRHHNFNHPNMELDLTYTHKMRILVKSVC